MLTTTPFFRPAAGTEPLPMIVMLPSRLTSPMSATTFVVPTSIPTRTASRSTVLVIPRIALGGFGGLPAGAARAEILSTDRHRTGYPKGGGAGARSSAHVRPVSIVRERHALDVELASGEQAAQQADLAGDEVGRPQARRVDPEQRDP